MLANAVARVGGEVGGRGALHMLCKVSLLPLLVSTFACICLKLKRALKMLRKVLPDRTQADIYSSVFWRSFLVVFSV